MKIHQKIIRLYTSRLTTELRLLLPLIFLTILIVSFAVPKTNFEINRDFVLDNPNNSSAHLFLAQKLLENNQLDEAKKEYALAQNQEGLEKIQKLKAEPEEIKNQIVFWQKIADQLPNYRDAYIKLAILNYKIGRLFDTKKFLDKALGIDPNSEIANKLKNGLLH